MKRTDSLLTRARPSLGPLARRLATLAQRWLIYAIVLGLSLPVPLPAFAQDQEPSRNREEARARKRAEQRAERRERAKKAAEKKAAEKKKAAAEKKKAAAAEAKEKKKDEKADPTAPAAPGAPPPTMVTDEIELPGTMKPFETGLDYKPTPPSTKVTFNLEDADLPDLVRLISQITGRRFIMPSKGRSIKATVYAPTKVTAAEAYQAFLSILELNGMALVPSGQYLKIVESGRVEGRAIPLYTDDTMPSGDRFVTRLHSVQNISSEDAAALLERFKSGDGSITAYAPTNMLIITDTGTNIQRMIRILEVIDVARTGEQIWVEPIHHADATELAARLTEIFEPAGSSSSKSKTSARAATPKPIKGKEGTPAGAATVGSRSGESRLTKILADERTNSLVILATERMYLRILEMLKYLDVSIEGEGRIHVHYLQHSDAEEMASTLQALVGSRSGGQKAAGKGAAAATASLDAIFEGTVAITAHKATNALVITSSAHDYAALRSVIDRLDDERKQVFIEAVIMELSVDRNNSFGTSFHGGIPDLPTDDSVSVLGFRAGNTIGGLQGLAANGEVLSGLAVGVQGPVIENSQQLVGLSLPGFGVAINALAGSGDANILSTPHLIATDNIEAEISVGQNVPLQTGGVGNLGGLGALAALQGNQQAGAAGLGALANLNALSGGSVPRQDVGTTVTITPHINASSEIRLEISQEISSAGAPSESGNLGVVSIDRTRAKTEVVVRDQQTVVIGGLMRDQLTNAATKVPVLGDIPLLGALFRSTSKRKVKKNLLLFLTPYIIRNPSDLRSIYERKMRERQEFLDRYFVFGDRDYEPPVDYSRTRGLLGEIINELRALDEQKQLMADAAARPLLTHNPQPPVGQAPDGVLDPEEGEEGELIEPEGDGSVEAPVEGEAAPEPPPAPTDEAPPPPPPAPEGETTE